MNAPHTTPRALRDATRRANALAWTAAYRLAWLIPFLLAAATATACGASRRADDGGAAASPAASAPALALRLEAAPGATAQPGGPSPRVEARVAGGPGERPGWRAVPPGGWAAGEVAVLALRTGRRGARLALGPQRAPAARLWLDAHTEVRLGSDRAHAVLVDVARGQARLASLEASVPLGAVTRRGVISVAGDDVVLHSGAPGQARLVETAAAPRAADWSLDVGWEQTLLPAGVGTLEARAPGGAKAVLALADLSVEATTRDGAGFAAVTVTHTFHNDSDRRLEGTFRFPVPAQALVTGLAMEMDGQLVEGELVERERARKIYNDIVDKMQDPALLEWGKGHTFKLRVFPIEPRADKRVVLRYLAPLEATPEGWAFRYDTAAPALHDTVGHLKVTVDGRTVRDVTDFHAGGPIVAPLEAPPASLVPTAAEESRDGVRYVAVRVRPHWPSLGLGGPARERAPRRVVLLVDTSRSTLEERDLIRDAVAAAVRSLGPDDRYTAVTFDVVTRTQRRPGTPDSASKAPALLAPTEANLERTLAFVESVEPDGASDLAAGLSAAAAAAGAAPAEILYIGDGVPTWGAQAPAALAAAVARPGGEPVPVHALLLGKRADPETLGALAAATGGALAQTRHLADVRRFTLRLATVPPQARLTRPQLSVDGQPALVEGAQPTLFPGDELVALVAAPEDAPLPKQATLRASAGGQEVTQTVAVGDVAQAEHVAQRWARQELARLGDAKAPREEVVALSLKRGVMSRYTSFLVLESDEAYKRYQIERRKAAEAARRAASAAQTKTAGASPRVTGADLETLGARDASLSVDRMQPGDPEVRIPAPADAREVLVIFPFGEVHRATFDPSLGDGAGGGMWTTRFLIDAATPDGIYEIRVRITHADGAVELLSLTYRVDTRAPAVEARLRPWRGGAYQIRVRQRVTRADLRHAGVRARGSVWRLHRRYAFIVEDLRRVDVAMPDGAVLRLRANRRRVFRGIWRPTSPIAGPVAVRVVATDVADNQGVTQLTLDATTKSWEHGNAE